MDIEQTVSETMAELIDSGFVKNTIKAQLEKAIKEAVGDVMRSYGDFGKALEAKMKEALGVDFKAIELPNYNQIVSNWVREIVDATLIADGKKQIEKNLATFFKPLEKSEWKITEIIEKFLEDIREEDHSNYSDEITFIVERDGRWTYFYFDAEKKDRKYACKHRIGVTDGHIFTINIDGHDGKEVKFDRFYGFEGFLFKLYATKAKVIDDGDDVSTQIGYDD